MFAKEIAHAALMGDKAVVFPVRGGYRVASESGKLLSRTFWRREDAEDRAKEIDGITKRIVRVV